MTSELKSQSGSAVRSTALLGFTWVCDPRWSNKPEPFYGQIEDGHVWWRGEKRKVLDIHRQSKGNQLQLA